MTAQPPPEASAPRVEPRTEPDPALDVYASPLSKRYASPAMQRIWSDRRKFETWRRVWLAVAESQHEMGLGVSAEQVESMRAAMDVGPEDLARAAEHERRLRHDVMAHVHAWGERCPEARGVIHLGLTSQDVNDNTELLLLDDAMRLTATRMDDAIVALGAVAERWKSLPTLGFTHFQPAQPTTVGRRAAQWAHDLEIARFRLELTRSRFLRLRGVRGATGTQASFLALFAGDGAKVAELERRVVERLAPDRAEPAHPNDGPTYALTGQTYPRVIDALVVSDLAAAASVVHKIATDIRLLANRGEADEPIGARQIGSSAMPYKRNPMRCERACALARFVVNLASNPLDTASTQWLERTLDDSANRRLVLPEAFLALDGALTLIAGVGEGLDVHEAVVRRNLDRELPFLITEAAMMAAAGAGRDRQEVHEAIRRHARAAAEVVKDRAGENDLLDRLRAEPLLEGVDLDALMDASAHVGLAEAQTEAFLAEVVRPLRAARPGGSEAAGGAPEV